MLMAKSEASRSKLLSLQSRETELEEAAADKEEELRKYAVCAALCRCLPLCATRAGGPRGRALTH